MTDDNEISYNISEDELNSSADEVKEKLNKNNKFKLPRNKYILALNEILNKYHISIDKFIKEINVINVKKIIYKKSNSEKCRKFIEWNTYFKVSRK